MLFQAAVLEEQRKPLNIRTLEVPQHLSVGQILVRVKYSGICGAQLGEIAGVKGPNRFMPNLLGHEGGAVVRAIGPGVRNLKIGDHVIVHWRKGVGIDALPPRYWCPEMGVEVGGGAATTWNEYSVVSENRLTKIDKDIPLDIAALFGCAVTTGLGISANEAQVRMGQSVVVFGCGGVGLNVIQGAMLSNAYPVIGLDIVEEKLHQALVMGATHVFNSAALPENLNNLLGSGADVVVDTTGNPNIMKLAWELAAPAGKVFLVAQLRHDQFFPLQTLPMHHGRTITGSDGGGTNPTTDIPRYLRLYKAGRLNLTSLITHRCKLEGINAMLDEVRAGKVGRAIIEM